jgi:hypothetical protein
MMIPFSAQAKTLDISVTSTASTSIALPSMGGSIRIVNEGPNYCFVSIGSGAQTATLPHASVPVATCTPVPVGDITLSIPPTDTALNISAVCRASQTARLSVQVGEGL